MINFKYDFSFLLQMVKFVFIPVLAIVVLTSFIIFIYSRKIKKEDIRRYNYTVEFWTTLLAILIIGSLFAVTIGFAISLSDAIEMYNLVKGNEVIYYLVLATPLVPLIFLVGYVYRFINVLLNKPKKEKRKTKEEDIVPAPTVFEEEKQPEQVEENTKKEEIKKDDEELSSPIVIEESHENESFEEKNIEEKPQETESKNIRVNPIVAPERKTKETTFELQEPEEEPAENNEEKVRENKTEEVAEEEIEVL